MLRVFVPGAEDATVTVGVATEDGSPGGTSFELDVVAGQVTDIPFEELEEGLYTVTVESTEPIVASARSSTGGGANTGAIDFGWFVAPVAPLRVETLLAVPDGPGTLLHIANPGTEPSTVDLTPLSGDAVRMEIAPGESTSVPIGAGAVYRLDPSRPVFAQVTFLGEGKVSAFPVNPANPSASALRVYP